jgi:hypothetical protein
MTWFARYPLTLYQEKVACKNFLVVGEKIIRLLIRDYVCTLLKKLFIDCLVVDGLLGGALTFFT